MLDMVFTTDVSLYSQTTFLPRVISNAMRRFSEMVVTQPVRENEVSVGKALHAGHEFQLYSGQLVFCQLPGESFGGVDLNNPRVAIVVGAGNERVAVRKIAGLSVALL